MYMNKNLDRGFKDLSIFEIGPIFTGLNPGEQNTVVCGLSAGKKSRLSWVEKERNVDVFDVKRDVVQTLVEAGYNSDKFFIDSETPNYYHPGKSGRLFLNRGKDQIAAYFGEIHPNILKKIDIKTETLVGFEIFVDNLKIPKKALKDQKTKFEVSDYQKSERDFAFIVNKEIKAQDLINAVSSVDKKLISNIRVFDVKRDVVQTLVEAGYNSDKFFIDSETPNYYHPGKSGRLFLNRGKDQILSLIHI